MTNNTTIMVVVGTLHGAKKTYRAKSTGEVESMKIAMAEHLGFIAYHVAFRQLRDQKSSR